jgi:hypothetical protein
MPEPVPQGNGTVLIAFSVLICFSTTTVSWASPELAAGEVDIGRSNLLAKLHHVSIPAELGKIDEIFIPDAFTSSTPLIVYLQEAHANLGAQQHISTLAGQVSRELGIDTILAEGGTGEADLAEVRAFEDEKVKDQVSKYWLKEGVLTGIEREAIVSSKPYRFVGIEDLDLYSRGTELFVKTRGLARVSTAKLADLKKKNGVNRRNGFNDDLRIYVETLERFDRESELAHRIAFLANEARNRYVNRWKYSEFEKVVQLVVLELNGADPEFYFRIHKTIESGKFFREMDALEEEIKETLFRTDEERLLDREARTLGVLEDLLSLGATSQQHEYFKENRDFILQYAEKMGLKRESIEAAEDFYQVAKARDEVLFSRLRVELLKSKTKRALLVAGGFHTEGIISRLRDNNFAYVLISPKISDEEQMDQYYSRLAGERASLEDFVSHYKRAATRARRTQQCVYSKRTHDDSRLLLAGSAL